MGGHANKVEMVAWSGALGAKYPIQRRWWSGCLLADHPRANAQITDIRIEVGTARRTAASRTCRCKTMKWDSQASVKRLAMQISAVQTINIHRSDACDCLALCTQHDGAVVSSSWIPFPAICPVH